MEIEVNEKPVNAKKLSISAHCSDRCSTHLYDEEGNTILEHAGYVPEFMPGQHYGDSVNLDIDLDTGMILNWDQVKNRAQLVSEWVEEHQNET